MDFVGHQQLVPPRCMQQVQQDTNTLTHTHRHTLAALTISCRRLGTGLAKCGAYSDPSK